MKKVLIIGNSGSGKSWLSAHLSKQLNIKEINLDAVYWVPGGFNKKRSPEIVDSELAKLCSESQWIVEGVFGALAEQLISSADTLIFLDIDLDICEKSLISRGSESSKQLDIEVAEDNFKELLKWASEYKSRTSKNSFDFHSHLFNEFDGDKLHFSTRNEVNSFISSSACNRLNGTKTVG